MPRRCPPPAFTNTDALETSWSRSSPGGLQSKPPDPERLLELRLVDQHAVQDPESAEDET